MEPVNTHSSEITPVVRAGEPTQGDLFVNEEANGVNDADEGEEFEPELVFQSTNVDQGGSDQEPEPVVEGVVEDGTRKRKRTRQIKLPPPPKFEPLQLEHHNSFARLPNAITTGSPNPLAVFRLFFSNSMLDTIVSSTNQYASGKEAGTS
ncbi:hypothetical protein BGW38_010204, partial [Lunasporangiospora selenospora]